MRADRLFSRRTSRQAVLSPSTTCDPLAQHPSPESRAGQIEFHPDTRFADQKRRASERAREHRSLSDLDFFIFAFRIFLIPILSKYTYTIK